MSVLSQPDTLETDRLIINEVSLRDGLQLEKKILTTDVKWTLFSMLKEAGVRRLELSSFVSPKAVPQMADASDLFAKAIDYPEMHSTALVVNHKGYQRAIKSGAKAIAAVLIPSDTLSIKNSRLTTDQALDFIKHLLEHAQRDRIWTRVYLSVAWVCPFEGAIPPARIIRMAEHVHEWGANEIALADTIGHAHPLEVGSLCSEVGKSIGIDKVAVHLHDTLALGLANAAAAIAAGVRIIDTSFGGLGGCPFAPGSRGNLATEDLLLMADKMGLPTGISIEKIDQITRYIQTHLGRPIGGRTQAWWREHHA